MLHRLCLKQQPKVAYSARQLDATRLDQTPDTTETGNAYDEMSTGRVVNTTYINSNNITSSGGKENNVSQSEVHIAFNAGAHGYTEL